MIPILHYAILLTSIYLVVVFTFPVKVIRSKKGELHFVRYALFESLIFRIYIHRIFKADEDKHLHSHPWDFISMVVWGKYIEEVPDGTNIRNIFKINKYTKFDFHKIKELKTSSVISLNFCYGYRDEWFYKVNDNIIESKEYRILKNEDKL